ARLPTSPSVTRAGSPTSRSARTSSSTGSHSRTSAVFQAFWLNGVTTLGSCGDVTRNVTGCPLAGADADELVDASPLVHAATRMLNGNPAFYNLPRKYKVTITGCRAWCSYPEINDVGLTAQRHPGTREIGFAVRVGGGLSADP